MLSKVLEASIRGSKVSFFCLDVPDKFQLWLIHFPCVIRATMSIGDALCRSNQGTDLKIIKRAVMQIRHAQQASNAPSCSVPDNTSVKQLAVNLATSPAVCGIRVGVSYTDKQGKIVSGPSSSVSIHS